MHSSINYKIAAIFFSKDLKSAEELNVISLAAEAWRRYEKKSPVFDEMIKEWDKRPRR